MFKDTKEGTTCWACPKCGGICSSGIEHTCPGQTNSIDNVRVNLTEKGLAEVKKKPKPKPEPKMIICHNCESMIEDFEGRVICHWCRSPYWYIPELRQRISAAIYHFKLGR